MLHVNSNIVVTNKMHFLSTFYGLFVRFYFLVESCIDKLPSDYVQERCKALTCQDWAIFEYCDLDWSEFRHCVPQNTGLIKLDCKVSCNACGTYIMSVFNIWLRYFILYLIC